MSALVLFLLWSLVEVHSQTAPYVSFMGENLPNHSYVDLTLVGNDDSDPGNTVRCNTDLSTCCRGAQGIHRGDWYFPDGDSLSLVSAGINIFEVHGAQQVTLRRRNNAMGPSGVYSCEVPTVPVHDDNDLSVRETVYVGLYASGGNELIRCHNSKPLSLIIIRPSNMSCVMLVMLQLPYRQPVMHAQTTYPSKLPTYMQHIHDNTTSRYCF